MLEQMLLDNWLLFEDMYNNPRAVYSKETIKKILIIIISSGNYKFSYDNYLANISLLALLVSDTIDS
jgi:hypothetical protein